MSGVLFHEGWARARARGLSDAFRRRVGSTAFLASGRAVALFARALTGRRRPARCAVRGGDGTLVIYIVTSFIDLAEQRRTCARAMISSSALLAAQCYLAGVPGAAVLLSRSTANFFTEDAELLTHRPNPLVRAP